MYQAKTNWQYNEIVTEEDLNRIESGIADAYQKIVQPAVTPESGTPIVPTRAASGSDILLTTTAATTIATYTPAMAGNFLVYVYLRVLTASTYVTVRVTYADGTSAQANTMLNAQSTPVGSYSLVPLYTNAAAGTPISVSVTAGTANQVYASATIMGV